ncbi:MAG: hypothetical protein INH41_06705 [Myxococcaceae bacterium]|nr:hypothetical protein [Myxococcaceae bacterium]
MTRPQQHVAIALMVAACLLLAPLVLPDDVVWGLLGTAWALSLAALVARAPYGVARAQLKAKQYEQAFESLRAFEALVTRQAWRRWLAFLYAGFQTSNPVALARTYQGVARLEQGRLAEAEALFVSALDADADCGLAWANRAVVAALLGDDATARAHVATARALGFTDSRLDATVAEALARGRATSPQARRDEGP